MGTLVQPKADESEVVRSRKGGPQPTTTVRVTLETKELLDRLRVMTGAETLDDVVYDLVQDKAQPSLGFDLPPRATSIREIAQRVIQIEEALKRVELDLLVTDPKTGVLFNPVRGKEVSVRTKGELVVKGHENDFFPKSSEAGVHVTLHHKDEPHWVSERDGEVSPAAVEHLKMRAKKKADQAPVQPHGRFFREPAQSASKTAAAAGGNKDEEK